MQGNAGNMGTDERPGRGPEGKAVQLHPVTPSFAHESMMRTAALTTDEIETIISVLEWECSIHPDERYQKIIDKLKEAIQ